VLGGQGLKARPPKPPGGVRGKEYENGECPEHHFAARGVLARRLSDTGEWWAHSARRLPGASLGKAHAMML
jgi:hypothetical protein